MNPGRLLVGVVLIALGVLYLLDRLGVAQAGSLIASFWPLVIIFAGVLQMAVTRRANIGAAIVVLVGLILLAATLNVLPPIAWSLFWPLVLIAIGVLVLAGFVTRGALRQTDDRAAALEWWLSLFQLPPGSERRARRVHSETGRALRSPGGVEAAHRWVAPAPRDHGPGGGPHVPRRSRGSGCSPAAGGAGGGVLRLDAHRGGRLGDGQDVRQIVGGGGTRDDSLD